MRRVEGDHPFLLFLSPLWLWSHFVPPSNHNVHVLPVQKFDVFQSFPANRAYLCRTCSKRAEDPSSAGLFRLPEGVGPRANGDDARTERDKRKMIGKQ